MNTADFLGTNFLFFVAMLIYIINTVLTKKNNTSLIKYFHLAFSLLVVFAVAYNLELYYASFKTHQPIRTLASSVTYAVKPILFYIFININLSKFKNKKLNIILMLPMILQIVLSASMMFSGIFVAYGERNTYSPGPLHILAYVILAFYVVAFLVLAVILFKKDKRESITIISICSIIVLNIVYQMLFYVHGVEFDLTTITIALFLYYMHFVLEKQNTYARNFLILLTTFVFVLLAMYIMRIPMELFNSKVHVYDASNDPNITIKFAPTAPWCKAEGIPRFSDGRILPENEFSELGYGMTINVFATNNTQYEIADWNYTLRVKEQCFVNKVWDGETAIQQFGTNDVFVGSLMESNLPNDSLQYYVLDGEHLIPLEVGDSITYYPSAEKKEEPIPASNIKESQDSYSHVTSGLILYYYGGEKYDAAQIPSLDDITGTYRLTRTLWSFFLFRVLVVAGVVLFMGILFLGGSVTKDRRARERQAYDEKIISESMNTFVNFIDSKDSYTQGHSRRVAEYSRMIAEELGMSEEEQMKVFRIALMHDCGKIGVPEGILNKPAALTDDEYLVIKEHTTNGGKILTDFSSIDGIQDGALYHHERFDGKGYPTGKKGEEIPEIARIICVADSFDAMNSARCYRKGLDKDTILRELNEGKDKQFDAKMVEAFLRALDKTERTDIWL